MDNKPDTTHEEDTTPKGDETSSYELDMRVIEAATPGPIEAMTTRVGCLWSPEAKTVDIRNIDTEAALISELECGFFETEQEGVERWVIWRGLRRL